MNKKTFAFKKIDAFTDGKSSGNPAGCVFVGENQSVAETEMQTIATQLKGFVNETAFMTKENGEIRLRYYSSECEVEFCGHATIAIMHNLLSENPDFTGSDEIPIRINAGTIPVFNRVQEENAVYIMAPSPEFCDYKPDACETDSVLFDGANLIDCSKPMEVINAGLRTLIVPVVSPEGCLGCSPDSEKLRNFCINNHVDIVLIYSVSAKYEECLYRTRVFAPRFGYLEDPATGSGNAAFGYYLMKYGLMPDSLLIEQSADRENPNLIKLRKISRDGTGRIIFGGSSVLRISGEYSLYL
ncbi:MAG: PhzF family phenazine biosynthesis protein [Firmicutes bacterium]|nr:PhzF family phenazine biosynthesis protein [Bacillota bacterium]